jgi:hypothetical protein
MNAVKKMFVDPTRNCNPNPESLSRNPITIVLQ